MYKKNKSNRNPLFRELLCASWMNSSQLPPQDIVRWKHFTVKCLQLAMS